MLSQEEKLELFQTSGVNILAGMSLFCHISLHKQEPNQPQNPETRKTLTYHLRYTSYMRDCVVQGFLGLDVFFISNCSTAKKLSKSYFFQVLRGIYASIGEQLNLVLSVLPRFSCILQRNMPQR